MYKIVLIAFITITIGFSDSAHSPTKSVAYRIKKLAANKIKKAEEDMMSEPNKELACNKTKIFNESIENFIFLVKKYDNRTIKVNEYIKRTMINAACNRPNEEQSANTLGVDKCKKDLVSSKENHSKTKKRPNIIKMLFLPMIENIKTKLMTECLKNETNFDYKIEENKGSTPDTFPTNAKSAVSSWVYIVIAVVIIIGLITGIAVAFCYKTKTQAEAVVIYSK